MRTITIIIFCALVSPSVSAQTYTELIKTLCQSGKTWRLAPAAGDAAPETQLRMNMPEGRVTTICNCTPLQTGKNTGVSLNPGNAVDVAYLPSFSCADVATSNLTIRRNDKDVEAWGVYTLEPLTK